MASVLQIVDPDDSSVTLFDLHDTTGANSGLYGSVSTFLLQDVDLGIPALKETGLTDVAKPLAFNRQATANMKINIRFTGSSYDNITKAVGTLARFLADGCVMKWVPDTSTQTRLIDVLPSPTPVLLSGRAVNMFEAVVALQTPEGIELNLERLGYTRAAKLDPAVNLLKNPTLLRDSNSDGTPDNWSKNGTPTLTISSATEALVITDSSAAKGIFSDETAAASVAPGQVVTVSAEIKVTSGAVRLSVLCRTAANATLSTTDATSSSATWTRLSVSATAPATTDHIVVTIYTDTGAATTFRVRNVQAEIAASASLFRVKSETLTVEPTTAGFAQLMPVFNPSDAPAPCQLEVAFPDATSKIVEADFALVSDRGVVGTRNLSDFLNGPNYAQCEASTNGWTRTLGTSTTSVADGNASAGNTAQYAPTTDALAALPTKIVTETRTTLLDSLRGRFKVYVRVKGSGAVEYNLQLHWGAGTVAGEANDAVTHDCTDVSSFHYVYIDVGEIELPREKNIAIGQLTLELYEWQSTDASGTPSTKSNFNADHFVFVPTDDAAIVTVPGESAVTYRGKDLVTPKQLGAPLSDPAWSAGSVKSGSMRLNAANEGAAVGDSTNGSYTGTATSIHQVDIDLKFHTNNNASITAYGQVVDFTTNTALAQTFAICASGNSPSLHWSLSVIDVAHNMQARVVVTSLTNNAHADVDQITINQVPFVGQNGRIRSDPGSLPTRSIVEQTDSSGNLGLEADATGVPFWLPPGLSLIWVSVFDVANSGYDENQSTLARTFTVTPTVYPRFWG